jgi:hypothetical protein
MRINRDKIPGLLNDHPWLYHYEVVVRRQGRNQLLARVPSEAKAADLAARIRDELEISSSSVTWYRTRGIHPVNGAKFVFCCLLGSLLLPWFWLRIALSLVWLALICGLLSSGASWQRGGVDDR